MRTRPAIKAVLAAAATSAVASMALAPAAALAAPSARAAADHAPRRAAADHAESHCLKPSYAMLPAVPWAQRMLQPGSAWTFTKGAGQIVAVLDSGVSATAPALSGAVLRGLTVATGKGADTDCSGHGTFVAGIIAAGPTAGAGFAGFAPAARILPVDVVAPDGAVASSAVATGIRFAVNSGASVVDISTVNTPADSPELRAAVAYAIARNVVVIAPVGENQVSQADQVSFPAAYPGVIAVSAVASDGSPIAAGATGVPVDLAAPGWNVVSIGPSGPGSFTDGGAAVATGFVAATAALVRGYYPRLSAAQVVHRLEVTADQPGDVLPDRQVGYGIVDPYTAVTTVLPEESGAGVPKDLALRRLRLPAKPVPDPWPKTAALIVLGAVVAGLFLAAGATAAIRHGHRRRWRPAG
jgi:membrane-anchored mycosin MYCP